MDLSTGGDIDYIRKNIIKYTDIPLGTVPLYQAAIEVAEKKNGIISMSKDDMVIERQARDGVDFMTVHVGVTLSTFERLKSEGRVMDIVSRGGNIYNRVDMIEGPGHIHTRARRQAGTDAVIEKGNYLFYAT